MFVQLFGAHDDLLGHAMGVQAPQPLPQLGLSEEPQGLPGIPEGVEISGSGEELGLNCSGEKAHENQ